MSCERSSLLPQTHSARDDLWKETKDEKQHPLSPHDGRCCPTSSLVRRGLVRECGCVKKKKGETFTEASETRDVQLRLDVDGSVDDEADKGEEEAEGDEGEAQAREVRREGEDEEHDGAGDVWRDGVQVGLDGAVAEALDDNGQEQRDGLQRHAQADLDGQDEPRRGVAQHLEGLAQVEGLVDDRRRVDLHASEGRPFLRGVEKATLGRRVREVPEGEERKGRRAAAFDQEEVFPVGQGLVLDAEDAKGQQAAECRGDGLRGVEDGEAAGEFASAVESGKCRSRQPAAFVF